MSPAALMAFLPPVCSRQTSMAAYLWLVWYHASSKLSPKHWALAVTYELNDRAYATFYQVCRVFSHVYFVRLITVM